MSNSYYNHSSALVAGNKARAEDVNSRCDSIEDGFDKLPSPHSSAPATKGFGEVFSIEDATDETHPVSARQVRDGELTYAEDTGAVNALVVSLPQAPTAYPAGMEIKVKVANTNTGACTINVNGIGVKNIKRISGASLSGGDLVAGRVSGLRYDGTDFIVLDGMYAVHSHDDIYYLKSEVYAKTETYTADEVDAAIVAKGLPPGVVIGFVGGYFGDGSNGSFTAVHNSAYTINAQVNSYGLYVADGSACNIAGSVYFDGPGRYLPNLTDGRFFMGSNTAGSIGGSATMSHTHATAGHELTIAEMPEHAHDYVKPKTANDVTSGSYTTYSSTITGTSSYVGGGDAHDHGDTGEASNTENRPPFLSGWYLVKVS